jgi:hypothetical protein
MGLECDLCVRHLAQQSLVKEKYTVTLSTIRDPSVMNYSHHDVVAVVVITGTACPHAYFVYIQCGIV